jgi:hypothetical protein
VQYYNGAPAPSGTSYWQREGAVWVHFTDHGIRGVHRVARVAAACAMLLVATATVVSAEEAPKCQPGQAPDFQLGFAMLKAELGATMGHAVECEHPEAATGDTLQGTSTGLAVYRWSLNAPIFTDGFRHWALTPAGLLYWEGSEIDPPPGAHLVGAEPRAPAGSPPGEPASTPLFGATTFSYPVVDPPASDIAPWCLAENPGCGQQPWWLERDRLHQSRLIQYRFLGPGLVTEQRFAEAIRLLWQWWEGKFLLREAAAHGVAIVTGRHLMSDEIYAAYHPPARRIRVTGEFVPAPTWMLATVLAHELKHAADHRAGARQAEGYENCIAGEQVAYEVEARFLAWLTARFQELPSPGLAASRLSAHDLDLYLDLHGLASSPDVNALAEEDYHDVCVMESSVEMTADLSSRARPLPGGARSQSQ